MFTNRKPKLNSSYLFRQISEKAVLHFYCVLLYPLVNYFWLVNFYHNWKQFSNRMAASAYYIEFACIAALNSAVSTFRSCLFRSMSVIKFSSTNNTKFIKIIYY